MVKDYKGIALWFGFGMLFLAFLITLFAYPTQAASPSMPPRPSTPTPTLVPPPTRSVFTSVSGAFIHIQVVNGNRQTFTMLQWQDGEGNWHDVDGWRGTLEDGVWKRWWLPSYLFGKGPFRWLVYEHSGGELLAVSRSFDLPTLPGQVVSVLVTLP